MWASEVDSYLQKSIKIIYYFNNHVKNTWNPEHQYGIEKFEFPSGTCSAPALLESYESSRKFSVMTRSTQNILTFVSKYNETNYYEYNWKNVKNPLIFPG